MEVSKALKYLNNDEIKIAELVIKYENEGIGRLIGFVPGGEYLIPLYCKVIKEDNVTKKLYFGLFLEDGKEYVEPIIEKDLQFALLDPFSDNIVFFEKNELTNKYISVFNSIVYDGIEYYIIGEGETQEEATKNLIKNLFMIYNIYKNNFKGEI